MSDQVRGDAGQTLPAAHGSDFRGYKKIDFEVFWNKLDRISIRQGGQLVSIHPGAIGYLYGMLKDVRENMEASGVEWRKAE